MGSEDQTDILQSTVDAVEKFGNVTAAARETGLPRSTVWQRYQKAVESGYRPAKPLVEKSRIRELEKLVELQQERIENLARSAYEIPQSPSGSQHLGSTYTRVIIPDTHGCFADEEALSAFLFDLEQLSPNVREIVMLGDHLDCGGFLAQHWTLGYVAEADYTFEDDVDAANQLLDRIQAACPEAKIHYLEGNHERRIEKWCLTQTLKNKKDASYLMRMFGVESVLHLRERGISHYKQGQFYDGVAIPSTIKLGKCYFTHGSRTGQNPCKLMLGDFGGNVVFGHVHRMDSYSDRTVSEGVIGAWSPGCLCRLQPLWNHTQITGWSHGYGVQLVREDDEFLHINVPIIGGKSYLMQFTERMNG